MEQAESGTDIRADNKRNFERTLNAPRSKALGVSLFILVLVLFTAAMVSLLNKSAETAYPLLFFIAVLPWAIMGLAWAGGAIAARKNFWKQYAADNGHGYNQTWPVWEKRGLMFKAGQSGHAQNVVSGAHNDLFIKIFEYAFVKGRGKGVTTHPYTVFEFRFPKGTFPHAYLNFTKDGYNFQPKGEISLPLSLSRSFKLYAPEQYEMEVLQIFSTDVLAMIQDLNWRCDLELLDQELIIYRPGHVHSRAELDAEFAKAAALATKLRPTLERMALSEIGTNKPLL